MNVITYNAAYSLYPRATFLQETTLAMARHTNDKKVLSKYSRRGFKVLSLSPSSNITPELLSVYRHHERRWLDDSHSWTIPLDVQGVNLPRTLSAESTPLLTDPTTHTSWSLVIRADGTKMQYSKFCSALFRYNYLLDDILVERVLRPFFDGRSHAEQRLLPTRWENRDIRLWQPWVESDRERREGNDVRRWFASLLIPLTLY
jgi:hypothetical protein